MKPTSIIFIIVSVVLIISGIVTVGIANHLAASEGIEITAQPSDDSGDYIRKYDYSADYIGQININVSTADIKIVGGSEQSYVEFINFPEGLYEFSHDDRKLTFNNNAELSDISALTSLITNFKGLRSFVNYYNMHSLPKRINIYLCSMNPVNIINVTVENGNVEIEGAHMNTDYNITVGNGNFNAVDVTTESYINASVEAGDVVLRDCDAGTLTLELESGCVNVADSVLDSIDADISSGDFDYDCAGTVEFTNLNLYTQAGSITVNGVRDDDGVFEQNYVVTANDISVEVGTGDIRLSYIPSAE